jgi:hypothetical protein
MEEIPGQQRAQLKDLAPSKWFKNKMESSFWLRIYTCLYIPHKDFSQKAMDATAGIPFDDQVYFGFYVMNGLKIPENMHSMYASEDGIVKIELLPKNVELRNSTYVLVFTPKKIDGEPIAESTVRRKLDIVTTILRTHTGINFMREVVYEGEVDAGIDRFSFMSKAIKLPQPAEGPHVSKINWLQSKEIFEILETKQKEIRDRVKLSLEYFGRALDEIDSFFLYWTALEILCKGTSQAIKSRLQKALGLKSLQEVEAIGFGKIASWRHDFFHKGIRPVLSADVERFIQLVFLDLLRYELNLQPALHTISLIQASGYDLSPIGLSNRKTNEDKGSVPGTKIMEEAGPI